MVEWPCHIKKRKSLEIDWMKLETRHAWNTSHLQNILFAHRDQECSLWDIQNSHPEIQFPPFWQLGSSEVQDWPPQTSLRRVSADCGLPPLLSHYGRRDGPEEVRVAGPGHVRAGLWREDGPAPRCCWGPRCLCLLPGADLSRLPPRHWQVRPAQLLSSLQSTFAGGALLLSWRLRGSTTRVWWISFWVISRTSSLISMKSL